MIYRKLVMNHIAPAGTYLPQVGARPQDNKVLLRLGEQVYAVPDLVLDSRTYTGITPQNYQDCDPKPFTIRTIGGKLTAQRKITGNGYFRVEVWSAEGDTWENPHTGERTAYLPQ